MIPDVDGLEPEIQEKLKELEERQEEEIQKLYATGKILNYSHKNISGNGVYDRINEYRETEHNITFDIKEIEKNVPDKNYFEYVVNNIKRTVKCEDSLIRQILYTAFSSYIGDDPLNLGILAPTSEGKTYAITESLQYFSDDDVMYIGQMSPKVLVRQKGIFIDKKTGEPLYDKVEELRSRSRELKKKKRAAIDKDEQGRLDEEIEKVDEDIKKMHENSKTLIDLRGKILVFLEPPQYELWELLKPILSHDKKEISFPFVDKTAKSNAETKDVIVRGWPACIFCSAKDESRWEIWNEIKSRILVTSPNMVQEKYQESNKLISQTKGLPNLIQEQIIISNEEVETTKSCVLLLKEKIINELKSKSSNGKISLWIPYNNLLVNELPANKGTDVRFVKKIFSLLNIIPIVKSDLRMVLNLEGEGSIIADLHDLREVLFITQDSNGLPKFKTEFFNKVFLPCYKNKKEPDFKLDKDTQKKIIEEERIAVTTRDLCDYFKEVNIIPQTTDNLKKTYINQLINEGLVDYMPSKVHGNRQYIYFPLVESSSIPSIIKPIDQNLQQESTIYERIVKNITEGWILHEIVGLISHRLRKTNKEFIEYVRDLGNIQIFEYSSTTEGARITLGEFIQKYVKIYEISIDEKKSLILTSFVKESLILSHLAKIDEIDEKNKKENNRDNLSLHHEVIETENTNESLMTRNTNILVELKQTTSEKMAYTSGISETKEDMSDISNRTITISKPCKCYFCPAKYDTEEEYLRHSLNNHPKEPAKPDLEMIQKMRNEWGYNIEPKGNPWEK